MASPPDPDISEKVPQVPSEQPEELGAGDAPKNTTKARVSRGKPTSSKDGAPHSQLPGFEQLVQEEANALGGQSFAHAVRELQLEVLHQLKYKICLHYMRLSSRQPGFDPQLNSTQASWEEIGQDLKRYSEAKTLWHTFHDYASDAPIHDSKDPVALAARMFACEVYEQRCRDNTLDSTSVRSALEAEKVAVNASLQALAEYPERYMIRRAEERKVQLRKLQAANEGLNRKMTRYEAFWARFIMALFGGVALIAPMLIMSLHDTKATALATTSVFVLVVAILLAWFMKTAEPKDVIAATAAYAAVLIVFVGTVTIPQPAESTIDLNPTNLSGGAITGIVLGVVVGLVVMMMLVTWCCCRPLLDGLLALFGVRRRRRRVEVESISDRDLSSVTSSSSSHHSNREERNA